MHKYTQFDISLPDETVETLKQVAKKKGMSFSSLLSKVLSDGMIARAKASGTLPEDYEPKEKWVVIPEDELDDEVTVTPAEEPDIEIFEEEPNVFDIHLYGETAALLKQRAAEEGITPTEWLRKAAREYDLKIVEVDNDDLSELNIELDRYVSMIESVGYTCKAKKKFTKADLDLIRENMDGILECLRKRLGLSKEEVRQIMQRHKRNL